MIKVTKATKKIVDHIFELDKKFYGDNFFTRIDVVRMASGKSKNVIYVNNPSDILAYVIIFRMPSGALYITSLAGTKSARRELLNTVIKRHNGRRIYTHGKEKWGMDLFRECGFKKKGVVNRPAEE